MLAARGTRHGQALENGMERRRCFWAGARIWRARPHGFLVGRGLRQRDRALSPAGERGPHHLLRPKGKRKDTQLHAHRPTYTTHGQRHACHPLVHTTH